jgi:RNA polymerase sigma-70 factor (ECF subfamily)
VTGQDFAERLAAARDGSEASFAALWRELNPPLLRYLRVIAPQDADDLASETWTTVARKLDRFSGDEDRFRAWVFVTARRRALDHFRRERRRPAVPVDPGDLRDSAATARGPSDDVVDTFGTAEAIALIARLPRAQAEVVALRAIAGLDVAQVAEVVGKRPGAVRVLAHRGLRTLARELGAGDPLAGSPTHAGPLDGLAGTAEVAP